MKHLATDLLVPLIVSTFAIALFVRIVMWLLELNSHFQHSFGIY